MSILARVLSLAVLAYRYTLSPLFGPACRYEPPCSQYALDALGKHGAVRGSWLAARRIARCHPWGGHGYDPVPATRRPSIRSGTAADVHEHGHEHGHGR